MMLRHAGAASGEDMVRLHRDILTLFSLFSSVGFTLATVHAVFTIVMVSTLSGKSEALAFSQRMGETISAGLYLFLFGVLFFVLLLMYHFFIYCAYVTTMLAGVGALLVVILFYVFGVVLRQVHAVYNIQRTTLVTKPLNLPVTDLDAYVLEFCNNKPGAQFLSPEALADFIRDRESGKRHSHYPIRPYEISFTPMTLKMIETLASKVLDAYVEKAIANSEVLESVSLKATTEGIVTNETTVKGMLEEAVKRMPHDVMETNARPNTEC